MPTPEEMAAFVAMYKQHKAAKNAKFNAEFKPMKTDGAPAPQDSGVADQVDPVLAQRGYKPEQPKQAPQVTSTINTPNPNQQFESLLGDAPPTVPQTVAREVIKAPISAATGVFDGAVTAPNNFGRWVGDGIFGQETERMEDVGEGGVVHGVAKFATAFAGAGRVLSGIKFLAGTTTVSTAARATLAGGLSEFVTNDNEARVSTWLNDTKLAPVVSDWMAGDPNDSELSRRVKNGLEGLGMGAAGEAVFATILAGYRKIAMLRSGTKSVPKNDPIEVPGLHDAQDEAEVWKYVQESIDRHTETDRILGELDVDDMVKRDLADRKAAVRDPLDQKVQDLQSKYDAERLEMQKNPGQAPYHANRAAEIEQELTAARKELDAHDAKVNAPREDPYVDVPDAPPAQGKPAKGAKGEPSGKPGKKSVVDPLDAAPVAARPVANADELLSKIKQSQDPNADPVQMTLHGFGEGNATFDDVVQKIASHHVNEQAGGRAFKPRSDEQVVEQGTALADVFNADPEKTLGMLKQNAKTARDADIRLYAGEVIAKRAGQDLTAAMLRNNGAEIRTALNYLAEARLYANGVKSGEARALRATQVATKDGQAAIPDAAIAKVMDTVDDETLVKLMSVANGATPEETAKVGSSVIQSAEAVARGKTTWDAASLYVASNRLSSGITQLMAMTNGMTTTLLAPISKTMGGSLTEARIHLAALSDSMMGAVQQAALSWRTGLPSFTGANSVEAAALPTKGAAGKFHWPMRVLSAQDQGVQYMNYRAYVRANAYRSGKDLELSDASLERWIKAKEEASITPEGKLTDEYALLMANRAAASEEPRDWLTKGLMAGMSKVSELHPAGNFLNQLVLPFLRAGSSASHQALEYAPGINLLYPSMRQRIMDGDPEARGKLVVGLAVAGSGIALAMANGLRGTGPTEPNAREAWLSQGPANSIKMYVPGAGVQWVSLRVLAPMDVPLAAMADAVQGSESLKAQTGFDAAAGQMVAYVANGIESKSMIQPLVRMADVFAGRANIGQYATQNIASSFIPQAALLRQTARIVDGAKHGTPQQDDVSDMLTNFKRYVPGADTPVKYNSLGETIPEGWTSLMRGYEDDAVIKELSKFNINLEKQRQTVGDGRVSLKAFTNKNGVTAWDRYNDLMKNDVKLRGILGEVFDNADYQKLTETDAYGSGQKQTVLTSLTNVARTAVLNQLYSEYPDLADAVGASKIINLTAKTGNTELRKMAAELLKHAK